MATAAQLTRLGLTSYEAKAYLALIRRDSSTAAQAARLATCRASASTTCWRASSRRASRRRGRAGRRSTRPSRPSSRSSGSSRTIATSSRSSSATAALIEELSPAFHAGKEHTDPLEYIEVLRDRRAINERFDELQAGIKREILVFTKPPYATPPQENVEGLEVIEDARGAQRLRVLDLRRSRTSCGRAPLRRGGRGGALRAELPLKLVIIDETIVMFGMEDPVAGSSELTIVVVEHPSLANVLKTAFDAIWEQGLTFDQAYDLLVASRQAPADEVVRRAQPAGGDQTYGVVVVTATNPSRSRIGRLSGEAST